jgi:Lon protease-like protein
MDKLPVFPLNTVIFPGTPLALHIFEERYRAMVRDCLTDMRPFIVSLIRNGEKSGASQAEPNRIACTAAITQMEPLPDGRMNITVVGSARVELLQLHFDKLYMTATARELPLKANGTDNPTSIDSKLRSIVVRYAKLLAQVMEIRISPQDIPSNTGEMAYLAAYIVQIPMIEKQQLLEIPDAHSLATRLLSTYKRELALFDSLRQPTYQAGAPEYAFSAN